MWRRQTEIHGNPPFPNPVVSIMTHLDESSDTADLQLDSLELDVKILQREREEDRKEFKEFQATANRNFATMQKNFEKIQDNFKRLLLDPDPEEETNELSSQGSVQPKDNNNKSPVIPAGRPK